MTAKDGGRVETFSSKILYYQHGRAQIVTARKSRKSICNVSAPENWICLLSKVGYTEL